MIKHYFKYIFSEEYRLKCIIEANRADLEKSPDISRAIKVKHSRDHNMIGQLERRTQQLSSGPINKSGGLTASTDSSSNMIISSFASSDNSCGPSSSSDSNDSSCSSSSAD